MPAGPRIALVAIAATIGRPSAACADIPPSPPGSIESVASSAPLVVGALFVASAAALLAYAVLRGGLTPATEQARKGCLELAVVAVAVLGLFVLFALPNFRSFRVKRRWNEAKSNLGAIRSTEVAYFAEWNVWVGGQPPTPVTDRRGNARRVPWLAGTRFSLLGFAPEGSVACSYSLDGPLWPAPAQGFTARAECDFDGDGELAVYSLGASAVTSPDRGPAPSGGTEISVSGDGDDF